MKSVNLKNYKALLIIILYVLSVIINKSWDFPYLQQIFGTILIFFLPGIMILPYLGLKTLFKKPFDLLFSIPFSLALISTGILLFSRFFSGIYTHWNQITLLLGINILLYLITLSIKKSDQPSEDKPIAWKKIAILILPIAVHLISWIIYPYFPGDDTYVLADFLKQSIDSQSVIQPVLERRPLLTPLLLLIYHGASFSIASIFMYVIPLAATLSFLLTSSLIIGGKKEKLTWADFIPVTVFTVSPYLMFQLVYSIPQSFILIWITPVILLSINSIKKKSASHLGVAIFLSMISINYHELGFVLLMVSLITSLIFLFKKYKENNEFFKRNLILFLIIILPYLIILQIFDKMRGLWTVIAHVTGGSALSLNLRWWYVNYYENPDGIIFSYPGIKGLLWYGYLGVLTALLFLIALYIYFRLKKTHRFKIEHLPLICYILLFFFLSEIYPRIFRVAFLPERAWIFLSIGLSIYFVVLVQEIKFINFKIYKLISVLSLIFVLIGSIATIYLSNNRGILMSKGDQNGSNFIENNTPENAIIVSTQSYNKGIAVFSNRKFYKLETSSNNFPKGNFDLESLTNYTITDLESQTKNLPAKRIVTVMDLKGAIISQTETALINKVADERNTPIYFVYSLNRFENTDFLGRPEYFAMNDIVNKNRYFSDSFAKTAIYNDGKVIIFKLK